MSIEDDIIANGLRLVRKGILSADWDLICQGYNSISGENLSVQKKKTRLESIREKLMEGVIDRDISDEEDWEEDEEEIEEWEDEDDEAVLLEDLIDWKSLTKAKIREELDLLGIDPEEYEEIKLKKDLISFAQEREKKIKEGRFRKTKHKGTGFAKGEVLIYSSVPDEDEKRLNRKIKKLNPRNPKARRTAPPEDTKNEEASVRFKSKPSVPPPWR